MRFLNSSKNLAELAYMMTAVLFLVVQYAPKDVSCEILDGKDLWSIITQCFIIVFYSENKELNDDRQLSKNL